MGLNRPLHLSKRSILTWDFTMAAWQEECRQDSQAPISPDITFPFWKRVTVGEAEDRGSPPLEDGIRAGSWKREVKFKQGRAGSMVLPRGLFGSKNQRLSAREIYPDFSNSDGTIQGLWR